MSDILGSTMDLINRYQTSSAQSATSPQRDSSWREEKSPSNELSFTDMLQLMIVQFQNQTIDNQADTSDMMNQLVQMSVVQAMTSLTTQMEQVTQASIMSYSASLVGQYVTLGIYGEDGSVQEIYGKVDGTGTLDGNTVIFVNDEAYYLSSIMAVGKLPPKAEQPDEGADASGGAGGGSAGGTNSGTGGETLQI